MRKGLLLVICGLWCCTSLLGQSQQGQLQQAHSQEEQSQQGQLSGEYPRTPWGGYPYAASYDAEVAAPDVHRVLFENENIMFLEVTNPPGFDVPMHGHPYPSVFARDTGSGAGVAGVPLAESHLDPSSPFAGKGWGQGGPPAGMEFPRCTTAPPEAPHKPINHGTVPVHFYRIEFRRLDGDDFATHWREWYPWMLKARNYGAYSLLNTDSVFAAPDNYRLLYEDGHVRLLEVTVRPGETTPMHTNPYAAVLAFNNITVGMKDVADKKLNPKLKVPAPGQGPAPSVFDMKVPTCSTVAPEPMHTIHNNSTIPLHYYRIEFKRVDGDDFATHWREWYPWMKYMKNMR